MFCPNCGKQLPENGNFCPNCGTKVAAAQQPAQVPPVQVPPVQVPTVSVQPEVPATPVKKKSKKGLIIGLSVGGGVLVILLAVIVAVFVLLGGNKGPTMTYKGMTFSYGMEVDLDKLESRFPDIELGGKEYQWGSETVSERYCWLEEGTVLILRTDDITEITKVVAFCVYEGSSAQINGVRVGASEYSFYRAFPQATRSVAPDEYAGDYVYFFCIYKGKVYDLPEYYDQLEAYRDAKNEEGFYGLLNDALKLNALMTEEDMVRNIFFGDAKAVSNYSWLLFY